jgi:hypothetical protein
MSCLIDKLISCLTTHPSSQGTVLDDVNNLLRTFSDLADQNMPRLLELLGCSNTAPRKIRTLYRIRHQVNQTNYSNSFNQDDQGYPIMRFGYPIFIEDYCEVTTKTGQPDKA